MDYIVIYREHHYYIGASSRIKAILQAFEFAKKDYGIDSALSTDFFVIEPKEYITIYGEKLDLSNNTVTYKDFTYSIDDEYYNRTIAPYLKRVCSAKVIYYYNGKRYEIERSS